MESYQLRERLNKWNLCKNDFWHFFTNYVTTVDDRGQIGPLPQARHLKETSARWLQEGVADRDIKVTVDIKSAQNMITWLSAAVMVWEVLFRQGIINGYFSMGQLESTGVKERCQGIIDRLPQEMLPDLGYKQTGESKLEIVIEHRQNVRSKIMFLNSSPKAGRSFAFWRVMFDEMAYMKNAKELYNGNKTRCVYLNAWSTPPEGKRTYFYYLYSNAYTLGIDAKFISYRDNPTHWTEDRIQRIKRGMSDKRWDREMEGKFISEGGLVYESFSREGNVVKASDWPIDPTWTFYRGMDFGYVHPFCHLWVAKIDYGSFFRWYIFDELHESKWLVEKLAKEINKRDERKRTYIYPSGSVEEFVLKNRYTDEISDAAGARDRAEFAALGIRTRASYKGKGSVRTKIDLVRTAMKIQPDGISGVIISENCPKTIFECENYMYKEVIEGENSDENPIKEWDHAVDVIGDIMITINRDSDWEEEDVIVGRR